MAGGQITTAVIGLCGVFVGGLITAGANWILAVRKERADAQKEQRTKAIELRTRLGWFPMTSHGVWLPQASLLNADSGRRNGST